MIEMELQHLEDIFDGKVEPTNLPFDLLRSITEQFDVKQEIGRGSYGVVYKGLLRNGVVAVKKVSTTETTKDDKFDREVQKLIKVKHKNIVRFLGYCSITENRYGGDKGEPVKFQIWERLLCFEYVSNGSLKNHITDELRGLEWHTRYEIIKGICKGLRYLHNNANMVHRDLNPNNILLDDLMAPKIADLGLSKLLEDGTSKNVITTDRAFTRWYCSPEFVDNGAVSRKLDMYSLGVIIIELVTGLRETPDVKNVLRRWRYRWNMSVKGTPSPLGYQQVARCIEIGLMCKDKEPTKRPTISKIIDYLNKMESVNGQISNTHELSIGQTIPFWNDLLWIEPLDLFFPFEVNKQISCTLQLTNETNSYIAFYIHKRSQLQYCSQPKRGILPPLSGRMVNITLQAQNKAPQDMQHSDAFTVKSTKVDGDRTAEDITEDMFKENMVDEVNLDVVFDAQLRAPFTFEESKKDLPHAPLKVSVPRNLNDAEASTSEARLQKIGPWGGSTGLAQDITVAPCRLSSVIICAGEVINSLEFSYHDHKGEMHTFGPWGGEGDHSGRHHIILLGPSEFLIEVSGTKNRYRHAPGYVITSLTLVTNACKYGPFGDGGGNSFNTPMRSNGSIVGFFARTGWFVDAIGFYVNAVQETMEDKEEAFLAKIRPWRSGDIKCLRDIRVPPCFLQSVIIRSGKVIISLAFSYSDNNGHQHAAGPWGGDGPNDAGCNHTILLGPSEFLKEVSGTIDLQTNVITSLMLVTSACKHGPFGEGGGIPFHTTVESNASIVGFFAHSEWYVNAIGLYVSHQKEEMKHGHKDGLAKIGPWGGTTGKSYDLTVPPYHLESVTICSDEVINSLAFSYTDINGQHHTAGPWGDGSFDADNDLILLEPSEYLVEVSGTMDQYRQAPAYVITSVTLVTNARKYGPFGRGGGVPFNTPMQCNGSIVGFFTRAGWFVDAIGVYVRHH